MYSLSLPSISDLPKNVLAGFGVGYMVGKICKKSPEKWATSCAIYCLIDNMACYMLTRGTKDELEKSRIYTWVHTSSAVVMLGWLRISGLINTLTLIIISAIVGYNVYHKSKGSQ